MSPEASLYSISAANGITIEQTHSPDSLGMQVAVNTAAIRDLLEENQMTETEIKGTTITVTDTLRPSRFTHAKVAGRHIASEKRNIIGVVAARQATDAAIAWRLMFKTDEHHSLLSTTEYEASASAMANKTLIHELGHQVYNLDKSRVAARSEYQRRAFQKHRHIPRVTNMALALAVAREVKREGNILERGLMVMGAFAAWGLIRRSNINYLQEIYRNDPGEIFARQFAETYAAREEYQRLIVLQDIEAEGVENY